MADASVAGGPSATARHPYVGSALDRWKTVHRTFFVLIDFILVALTQFEAALGRGDPRDVRAALIRIETLLLGSAVALRLAGDFPSHDYGPLVRDDMLAFDPEFTGSFSVDHTRMIKRLTVLQRIPAYAGAEHRRVLSALDAVYRSHAGVCECFVGSGPSLAQGSTATLSGVEQLLGTFRERSLRRARCPVATGSDAKHGASTREPASSAHHSESRVTPKLQSEATGVFDAGVRDHADTDEIRESALSGTAEPAGVLPEGTMA